MGVFVFGLVYNGFVGCRARQVRAFEYSDELHNSCVGSMVASHVLGLADRHKDNMLLLRGSVFAHIDFGFVAGERPWPFDTGPFPIPALFRRACGRRWTFFLNDCQRAYEILQGRREQLCLVARMIASSTLPSDVAPVSSPRLP